MSTIRAIITGVTGMVGEGVLHECLESPHISAVLVLGRKSCGVRHPKLKEVICPNFSDTSAVNSELSGYNACYFCAGVSSLGMSEEQYTAITHTLTLSLAQTLSALNPDMTFCYVSGSGTDSSEKGKVMWARVKGKTENDLMKIPFKRVFAYRPAFILPTKGLKNTLSLYKYITWIFPAGRALFPQYFSTLKEIGLSMINVARFGYERRVLEVNDIVTTATMNEGMSGKAT